MKRTYDEKCYELALAFLEDHPNLNTDTIAKAELWMEVPGLMVECAACSQPINSFWDCELGHIESKGSGGHKRDDRRTNLCLEHTSCNRDQGSMSLEDYRRKKGYA